MLVGPSAIALVVASAAASAGAAETPTPGPAVVETVAGPGFCRGDTILLRSAGTIGALAVDGAGRVYADTGPPSAGTIRVIDAVGARLLRTGVARGPEPEDALAGPAGAPSAGRLAGDTSGVLVATPSAVVLVDPTGTSLTPVAGRRTERDDRGTSSSAGDGGPALAARFAGIRSIATDDAHNLYIADEIDPATKAFAVRFVNRGPDPVTLSAGTPQEVTVAPGSIDTIAGQSATADGGEGGPAGRARLVGVPPSMAVAGGRLYLGVYAPTPGGAAVAGVRMVNLNATPVTAHGVTVDPGHIATVAGGGRSGFGGDGGPARSAAFSHLPGIAAGPEGQLYLADQLHHRIRMVDQSGTITTVAGLGDVGPGDGGFNGNDRRAVEARLHRPYDVKVGPRGLVYVADAGNEQLRVIERGTIRLTPGHSPGWGCEAREPAPPEFAQPGAPAAVDVGEDGTVYVATTGQVRTLDRPGRVGVFKPPDPMARPAARAPDPLGLSTVQRRLYLVSADGRVRLHNLSDRPLPAHGTLVPPGDARVVTELSRPDPTVPVTAVDNQSNTPGGTRGRQLYPSLVADGRGSVFVADPATRRITEIDSNGHSTPFAGDGAPPERRACCTLPAGLAVDRAGNLYVSDARTQRVWVANRGAADLTANGQPVAAGAMVPVAGTGKVGVGGEEGGRALEAGLPGLRGLAVDDDGTLYVAVIDDHSVRRIDPAGRITTLAGVGRPSFNGDGLKAAATGLDTPVDVAVDRCGNVLIADAGNDRLRRVNLTRGCDPFPKKQAAPEGFAGGGKPMGLPLRLLLAGAPALAGLVWWHRRRRSPARG